MDNPKTLPSRYSAMTLLCGLFTLLLTSINTDGETIATSPCGDPDTPTTAKHRREELDGEPLADTLWHIDSDGDGVIDNGERVYRYRILAGPESGIEAVETTNTENPQLLWKIQSHPPATPYTNALRDLAQIQSPPQLADIYWCSDHCHTRKVLFFAGGYDPVYDTARSAPDFSRGNAVYMVDALTGELIWSAGGGYYHALDNNPMRHSIAGGVKPVDLDGDEHVDALFVIDILGSVFRFDINQTPTSDISFASGGLIADLGGGEHLLRHFFNPPDIAWFDTQTGPPLLTIAVASGNRTNPQQPSTADALFVLIDRYAESPPQDYRYVKNTTVITPDHLSPAGEQPVSPYGWMLPLTTPGEKALSPTRTFNGHIFLNTFIPGAPDAPCAQPSGTGRLYIVNALTGASSLSTTHLGGLALVNTPKSTSTTLPFVEINQLQASAAVELIFTPTETCVPSCGALHAAPGSNTFATVVSACIGNWCPGVDMALPLHKTYWREN